MTFSEFEKDMQKLKDICLEMDKVYEDATKVFGEYCFESPWYEVMYRAFALAMNIIAKKYDDLNAEWISWYIYENNWGKDKMEAGLDGKTFPIITIKDIWTVMKLKVQELQLTFDGHDKCCKEYQKLQINCNFDIVN